MKQIKLEIEMMDRRREEYIFFIFLDGVYFYSLSVWIYSFDNDKFKCLSYNLLKYL